MPVTERSECRECRGDISSIVRAKRCPAILIKTLQSRALKRENLSEPVSEYEFGIGEMFDHANDGPAAWALRLVQRVPRDGTDQRPEIGDRLGKNGQRISVADERRHASREGAPSIRVAKRGCLLCHNGRRRIRTEGRLTLASAAGASKRCARSALPKTPVCSKHR
jgi:hypothetical protein